MRCDCCNKKLTVAEVKQRHAVTDEFLNTCNRCLDGLGIPIKGKDHTESVLTDEFIDGDVWLGSEFRNSVFE